MKIVIWALLTSSIFLSTVSPVFAAPIINEVYPRPTADEKEWIELYNNSDQMINLSGWILMDELSTPSIIYQFPDEINDQEIQAQEFSTSLIDPEPLNSQVSNLTMLETQAFLVIELPVSKLNNTADAVKLFNNQGQIIDQLEYLNSESGMSFSVVTNNSNEKEVILSAPTKGETNIQATNSQNPKNDEQTNPSAENDIINYSKLIISEIMACPESNNPEWIKIYNPNEVEVSLNNWQAMDEANNQISLSSFENIAGLESKTINLTTKILNNSGDSVFLFDPNHFLVDKFSYTNCTVGVPLTINDSSINQTILTENQTNEELLEYEEEQTDTEKNEFSSIKESGGNTKLTKINSLLEIINVDKYPSNSANIIKSKRIPIRNKSLAKSAILSVIIGGAILSGSGLLFINKSDEKI